MLHRWWQTCAFTRVMRLRGAEGSTRATLSFHSTGRYRLRKGAHREGGAWTRRGANIEMTADDGGLRRLTPEGDQSWRVLENDVNERATLEGWTLAP